MFPGSNQIFMDDFFLFYELTQRRNLFPQFINLAFRISLLLVTVIAAEVKGASSISGS